MVEEAGVVVPVDAVGEEVAVVPRVIQLVGC